MANSKVNKKSTGTVKKTSVKQTKTVDKNVEENAEVIALKQQIEEMKKAMELLTMQASMANTQPAQVVINQTDDEVVIGCRLLQGVGWGDPADSAGEIRLRFNEEQAVTVEDMKKFFRQHSVKKLFIDGLCYFTKPEDYKLFGIRKYIDLSDETLVEILENKDTNEIVRELDRLTENKKNGSVVNCIIFRICDMIRKQSVNLDYYTRKAIEGYLAMEFDRGIATLTSLDNLPR